MCLVFSFISCLTYRIFLVPFLFLCTSSVFFSSYLSRLQGESGFDLFTTTKVRIVGLFVVDFLFFLSFFFSNTERPVSVCLSFLSSLYLFYVLDTRRTGEKFIEVKKRHEASSSSTVYLRHPLLYFCPFILLFFTYTSHITVIMKRRGSKKEKKERHRAN